MSERRERGRPPARVQALRLVLVAQTAVVVALWTWRWRALQSYAWPGGGVETDLYERGLSYLLVLLPSIPVNLLAVAWLGRGGRRARFYLAAAAALTAVQQILLLTPVDPGGSAFAGLVFALLIGPLAFTAAALALTGRSREWIRADRDHPRGSVVRVETPVWAAASILAFGIAAGVGGWVQASGETGPPTGEYDESDAWARMEAAVTYSATDADGFAARTVEVEPCGYRTGSGLLTYRYRIAYDLVELADEEAFTAALRERWSTGGHELLHDGTTFDDATAMTAASPDGLTLSFNAEPPVLAVQSGCLERTTDDVPCIDPQGSVPPARDKITGLACTEND